MYCWVDEQPQTEKTKPHFEDFACAYELLRKFSFLIVLFSVEFGVKRNYCLVGQKILLERSKIGTGLGKPITNIITFVITRQAKTCGYE